MAGPQRRKIPFALNITLALCVALTALLSHAPAQSPAPARTLFVTVTDKQGNFVKGLKREDFAVLEGKRRHEPSSLAETDAPATVVILLDASGSTAELWEKVGKGKGGNLREALARFLEASHPQNEYFVVAFGPQQRLLVEGASEARDVLSALELLGAARPKGPTAFYDALHFALAQCARGRHAKRVILALTDGQDNASKRDFRETRRAIAESDALVYGIGMLSAYDDSSLGAAGRSILKELTETSGGAPFFPLDGRELMKAADRLALELRSQYALGFAVGPSEKRDGWHELKVTVSERLDEKGKRIKFEVRARRGFYDEGARRAGAATR
jgi:Ca-activated chloride channel family protein